MSDFGGEMSNSSLSLMKEVSVRVMEALLKLLSKIFEMVEKRTDAAYRLRKKELKAFEKAQKDKSFIEEVEGMTGFVEHKLLEKAGVPLVSIGAKMSEEDFKKLVSYCKREGIGITGVEDVRERELTGRKFFLIECKQQDLFRIKELTELIALENRIAKCEKEIAIAEEENNGWRAEIAEIKDKDGELSQEDLDKIAELESNIEVNEGVIAKLHKQIEALRYGYTQELNDKQVMDATERAVNGENKERITFDDALDRYTGRVFDRDATFYVVDATDPQKYIVCDSKKDTFQGVEYTKTEYGVYNGDEKVFSANDGRFEDRPKGYWNSVKAEIKEKGDFGDMVFRFNSKEEMEAYRKEYAAENEREFGSFEVGKENRDYGALIKDLEAKIDECGGKYHEGAVTLGENGDVTARMPCVVTDKETGKQLTISENMSEADRCRVAEAVVCGKQIDNYKELARIGEERAIAMAEMQVANQGTPAYAAAKEQFDALEERWNAAKEQEAELLDARMEINAGQAKEKVSENRDAIIGKESEHELANEKSIHKGTQEYGAVGGLTKEQWKSVIAEERAKIQAAKGGVNLNKELGVVKDAKGMDR